MTATALEHRPAALSLVAAGRSDLRTPAGTRANPDDAHRPTPAVPVRRGRAHAPRPTGRGAHIARGVVA